MPAAALLIGLLLLAVVGRAALTFEEGPLAGRAFASVPTTGFLGPQRNLTVTGRMVYLTGVDPCRPGTLDVRDLIVLVDVGPCSYEAQYARIQELGAAAFLIKDRYAPGGIFHFMRDGPTPPGTMLFVQMFADPALATAMAEAGADGLRVTLTPDPNPWVPVLLSWRWQVFQRWIPCALFSLTTLLSWRFLIQHLRRLHGKARASSPAIGASRTLKRSCQRLSIMHAALALLALVAPIIALGRGLGGSFSTTLLSAPLHRLLYMQLLGYTNIVTVMTSSVWNRAQAHLTQTAPVSRARRCLTGGYPTVLLGLYAVLVVNEVLNSYLMLTYAERGRAAIIALSAVTAIVLSVWITAQTIAIILQFWSQARVGTVSQYARLLVRLTFGLGLCSLVTLATMTVDAVRNKPKNPADLTVWSIIGTLPHCIGCLFLVLLFRPARLNVQSAAPSRASRLMTGRSRAGAPSGPQASTSGQQFSFVDIGGGVGSTTKG